MFSRRSLLHGFLLFLPISSNAGSFNLSPWILVFEPENKVISQIVTFRYESGKGSANPVQGPSPKDGESGPIPVEISVSARELSLEGAVTYPSSMGADDFVVYPSQFILYPGDSKKVQVQWVGTKVPDREISLGFIATQIPLNFTPTDKPKTAVARVEMVTRYEGILVVRPKNIKPNVVVDTAYARKDSAGANHLVMILNNKGTGMQTLKRLSYAAAPLDKNGKIRLADKTQWKLAPPTTATNQSLLAGFRRKVEIPWPADLPVGPINATVNFSDAAK